MVVVVAAPWRRAAETLMMRRGGWREEGAQRRGTPTPLLFHPPLTLSLVPLPAAAQLQRLKRLRRPHLPFAWPAHEGGRARPCVTSAPLELLLLPCGISVPLELLLLLLPLLLLPLLLLPRGAGKGCRLPPLHLLLLRHLALGLQQRQAWALAQSV